MMTFRRFLRIIAVFAMFITITAPASATAEEGLTWSLSDDGVLTISCPGAITDSPWSEHSAVVRKIVINEGCTKIGFYSFFDFPLLEEVILPIP